MAVKPFWKSCLLAVGSTAVAWSSIVGSADDVGAQPPRTALKPGEVGAGLFKTPTFRRIAPGVEQSVNSERSFLELSAQHDVPELLKVDANFGWAKDIQFTHDIWALDFTFKPVRMIEVDAPAAGGKLEKKLVWYMVYRVKNPGVVWHLDPTKYADPDKKVTKLPGDEFEFEVTGRDQLQEGKVEVLEDKRESGLRFNPTFLLFARDQEVGKQYMDQILPAAQKQIAEREDALRFTKQPLKNSVEMAAEPIPASPEGEDRSVWGVAVWDGVDPRTDFFSIYIQGLTNAHVRKYKDGQGWWYGQKTLRLDFRRPGDEFLEHEDEIRYLGARWLYLDTNWASSPDDAAAAQPVPMVKQ